MSPSISQILVSYNFWFCSDFLGSMIFELHVHISWFMDEVLIHSKLENQDLRNPLGSQK
jgi:hypothetical protein